MKLSTGLFIVLAVAVVALAFFSGGSEVEGFCHPWQYKKGRGCETKKAKGVRCNDWRECHSHNCRNRKCA
jgi:hypothetical protein